GLLWMIVPHGRHDGAAEEAGANGAVAIAAEVSGSASIGAGGVGGVGGVGGHDDSDDAGDQLGSGFVANSFPLETAGA
ncbi:MAG TPA: hypothetical protein PLV68_18830, partial [Ilumatobacteraceae bacterium]|nr:hypothetical protein [Ilumatobacteraceae bacterium]